MILLFALQAAASAGIPAPVPAQTQAVAAVIAPSEGDWLRKGTVVTLAIDRALASDAVKPGERIPLSLAEPVLADGRVLIEAGAAGEGEVIHAAKARWGGKAGELIINARFLDCGAVRIPVGKLRFAARGQNNSEAALAATMVVLPAAFIISGGNVRVPQGTLVSASIGADVQLPKLTAGRCGGANDLK